MLELKRPSTDDDAQNHVGLDLTLLANVRSNT